MSAPPLVSQGKLEEQLEKVKYEKEQVVQELTTARAMVSNTNSSSSLFTCCHVQQCQLAENKHAKLQEDRLHIEVSNEHCLPCELMLSSKQSELEAMTSSHTTIEKELAVCQTQLQNLKTQLAYVHSQVRNLLYVKPSYDGLSCQLEAMTQEKLSAHQQLEQAATQVQQLIQRVQELEATKDQLEQDIYTSQQSLEQMQDWGSKVR